MHIPSSLKDKGGREATHRGVDHLVDVKEAVQVDERKARPSVLPLLVLRGTQFGRHTGLVERLVGGDDCDRNHVKDNTRI